MRLEVAADIDEGVGALLGQEGVGAESDLALVFHLVLVHDAAAILLNQTLDFGGDLLAGVARHLLLEGRGTILAGSALLALVGPCAVVAAVVAVSPRVSAIGAAVALIVAAMSAAGAPGVSAHPAAGAVAISAVGTAVPPLVPAGAAVSIYSSVGTAVSPIIPAVVAAVSIGISWAPAARAIAIGAIGAAVAPHVPG